MAERVPVPVPAVATFRPVTSFAEHAVREACAPAVSSSIPPAFPIAVCADAAVLVIVVVVASE